MFGNLPQRAVRLHVRFDRLFEAEDGGGGALVAPLALLRLLDGGEIAQKGRNHSVRVACPKASLWPIIKKTGAIVYRLILTFAILVALARAGCRRAAADDARRLLPHGQRHRRTLQPRPRRRRAAAVAGESRAAHSTRPIAASTSSKSSTRATGQAAVLARVQLDLRRMGNDRRGEGDEPDVFRVAAISARRQAGAHRRQEARCAERVSRRVDASRSIRPTSSSSAARRPPPAGPLIKLHESGDPATKLDLLILGDGYTAARAGQVRARRPAAGRPCCSRRRRSRSGSATSTSGASSPASPQSGISRPSQHIFKRTPLGTTYDAFDSERYVLDVREPRVSRDRGERAVRRRRDSGEQRDLRRRRHLRSVQHRRRRQRLGAVHLRPRVRPSSRRRSPTSTTRRTWRICRPPIASSRGSRTSRRCSIPRRSNGRIWSRPARRCRRRGRRRSSSSTRREIQRRRREIRAANRPESEMDALFREELAHETDAARRAGRYAAQVGAFEGANYEARGFFRPQIDCIMFTRNLAGFCAVCRRAIAAILDLYSR